MGYNQEAYDADYVAIARALETAALRAKHHKLGAVTVFADSQAATTRMASDEPEPGLMYAIAARKHLSTQRRLEPGSKVEICWCPAHKGIEENEIAGGWAKQAADMVRVPQHQETREHLFKSARMEESAEDPVDNY